MDSDVRYSCKRDWHADGDSAPMDSIADRESLLLGGKRSVQLVRVMGKFHPVPPSGPVLIPGAALFNRESDAIANLENRQERSQPAIRALQDSVSQVQQTR